MSIWRKIFGSGSTASHRVKGIGDSRDVFIRPGSIKRIAAVVPDTVNIDSGSFVLATYALVNRAMFLALAGLHRGDSEALIEALKFALVYSSHQLGSVEGSADALIASVDYVRALSADTRSASAVVQPMQLNPHVFDNMAMDGSPLARRLPKMIGTRESFPYLLITMFDAGAAAAPATIVAAKSPKPW